MKRPRATGKRVLAGVVLPHVAALAMVIAPPMALAQETTAETTSDPAMQTAKEAFEDAQRLFIKEDYEGAAARFVSAYEAKPFAAFLFNAAVAFERSKKWELAISYLERYLERKPDAKDAEDVRLRIQGLQRVLRESTAPPTPGPNGEVPAAPQVAMLPAIETKGLVIIDSKPQGATIYLDDKKNGPLGETPWEGSLEPRKTRVILEAKGFKTTTRDINPRPDKILELVLGLSEEHFLGWIEVASNVAGADVFIDRKEIGAIGKTPYTGHVKPGKHTIWVERPGYGSEKREIEVLPGTATNHQIDLSPVAVGWIAVVGKHTKGGRLIVNKQFACATPCQHEIPPGVHKVVVEKEGMEDYESDIEVKKATQSILDISFSPRPPRTKAWTTAIISAVFLGGGIYAGLQAKDRQDGIENDIANNLPVNTNDPRRDEGKIYAIGANIAFGVAAITGAMSLYNFLKSGPPSTAESDEKELAVSPIIVPGGAGIGAGGRF